MTSVESPEARERRNSQNSVFSVGFRVRYKYHSVKKNSVISLSSVDNYVVFVLLHKYACALTIIAER